MSVKYLTDEWATAMADAVNADDNFQKVAGTISVAVQNKITDGPGGEVAYGMGIKEGKAFCELGEIDAADVTITQTHDIALKIAKGELNLQNAFMQGQIKVEGNLAAVMQYQPQLQSLESAVRAIDVDYN